MTDKPPSEKMRKALRLAYWETAQGLSVLDHDATLLRRIEKVREGVDMRTIKALIRRGWLEPEMKGWMNMTPAGIEAARKWAGK